MTTKVKEYTFEYLANVQSSSGAICYSWKMLDENNYELTWLMGQYSNDMRNNFEKNYAVQLLTKYPGVYILSKDTKFYTSNQPLATPPTPIPQPPKPDPKPPVYVTCPMCNGTGKVQSKCPTCNKMTLDTTCPKCNGSGKVQVG